MPIAPLYVHRAVENGDDIRAYAARCGLPFARPSAEMHVTIARSLAPVDWRDMQPPHAETIVILIKHGRLHRLGNAVVLAFTSPILTNRWQSFRAAGASWRWPTYQPHVTITYRPLPGWNPALTPSFSGCLVLGPEQWDAETTFALNPPAETETAFTPRMTLASAAS